MKQMLKAVVGICMSVISSVYALPQRFCEIAGGLFPATSLGCRVRGWLIRPFLKSCGSNLQLALAVKLEECSNIQFGNDVYIGHGSWLSGAGGGICFDDQVMLGPYVTMVSGNHAFAENGSARFCRRTKTSRAIHIGFGTWIAAHCTVTAGVKVGQSCLLAAGAVACKDVPDRAIVAGVPARVIGWTNGEH